MKKVYIATRGELERLNVEWAPNVGLFPIRITYGPNLSESSAGRLRELGEQIRRNIRGNALFLVEENCSFFSTKEGITFPQDRGLSEKVIEGYLPQGTPKERFRWLMPPLGYIGDRCARENPETKQLHERVKSSPVDTVVALLSDDFAAYYAMYFSNRESNGGFTTNICGGEYVLFTSEGDKWRERLLREKIVEEEKPMEKDKKKK